MQWELEYPNLENVHFTNDDKCIFYDAFERHPKWYRCAILERDGVRERKERERDDRKQHKRLGEQLNELNTYACTK